VSDPVEPTDYAAAPSSLRQAARLEDVPEIYRKKLERLAVELALNINDAEDIFDQYGYSPDAAAELVENPAFVLLMQQAQKEVFETGLSFRTKAKLMAGELLPYAHDIATDPLQSAAVRADLIKWTAKVADYEPKAMKDDSKTGGGLTLSITFAGAAPQQVIATQQREALTIDQET
jgi:hypothetical protein